MVPGPCIFKGKLLCVFFLKVLLKYAKIGKGMLNYKTYFRMGSMFFLSLGAIEGMILPRATLFKIQKKDCYGMKFVQLPGAKSTTCNLGYKALKTW